MPMSLWLPMMEPLKEYIMKLLLVWMNTLLNCYIIITIKILCSTVLKLNIYMATLKEDYFTFYLITSVSINIWIIWMHIKYWFSFNFTFISTTISLPLGSGENQKTQIRNESLTYAVARAVTPDILNCNELRSFWVSWYQGLVRIGSGQFNVE
jgi:hypothetical protein